MGRDPVESALRELAPQVLGALVRQHGHFDACEDALQEAMIDATVQWGEHGVPERPRGWLIRVASRRLTDRVRSDTARTRREQVAAALEPDGELVAPAADAPGGAADDTMALLFLCCHPALSPPSRVALTLRAVGGLTTAQIARAFLVPEATMAQRISRAKQTIRAAGGRFHPPTAAERRDRLGEVLHVLYLVFNEGYMASAGPNVHRSDLVDEAVRLTRALHRAAPDEGEITGLLALLLLTDARRAARTTEDGGLVPLTDQDRSRWDRAAIAEGSKLITASLARTAVGPYQLQAAIAAVHAEAADAEDTDWPQILALYELLATVEPSGMVTLNRAVATAMVRGPAAGLELLRELDGDRRMAGFHRVPAVRGHLLELAGDLDGARSAFDEAARRCTNLPEQRYLRAQAARLSDLAQQSSSQIGDDHTATTR